ncbi:hypothetical protein DEH80_06540 [Abyssibacter profundi]|uniref:Uncharacterized protein n=1 Tax=Abyssibacter profundi TaxID=2182787 RepID=A0A363UM30_9GAMM|nr:hypothetical protein DEH80_06540 [Abyssibacter profundi]
MGAGAFFLPLWLLFAMPSMAQQADIGWAKAIGTAALIPVILIFQGIILGGIVKFGWWIIRKVQRSPS